MHFMGARTYHEMPNERMNDETNEGGAGSGGGWCCVSDRNDCLVRGMKFECNSCSLVYGMKRIKLHSPIKCLRVHSVHVCTVLRGRERGSKAHNIIILLANH